MSRRRFRPDDAFDEPFDGDLEFDTGPTGERGPLRRGEDPPCSKARADLEAARYEDAWYGRGL